MKNKFYITTTLPYVNAEPHIGFALEITEADVVARFHRNVLGEDVFFNTGTDEHGLKIHREAEKAGTDTQRYCDDKSKSFLDLKNLLNLSFNNFIRTTNKDHIRAAQEFWKKCDASGDIYKKMYKIKYCVGCELEKTDSELVDEKCPFHPDQELEIIEEENYFFRFSKYQDKLLELYKNNPEFVLPKKRLNEVKSFVEQGIEDFSISRLKSKMPWGVEVPGDSEHVMYVWFDALVNYISAIGWPNDMDKFNSWWPVVQLAGKDNVRQQAAMWQAMLISAGFPNSKQVFINGFIGANGKKMSKSLGNVINPQEMVNKFGIDGTRYLLLSFGLFGEDMDVSWEKFTEKYNADLANGLGNLVSRVVKLSENFDKKIHEVKAHGDEEIVNKMELGVILKSIWLEVKSSNQYIEDNEPWKLAKTNQDKFKEIMTKLIIDLYEISNSLIPFMPETAEKIRKALETKKTEILFQRIDTK
ncbi:methionine--tRNA ligase [bacterium BMS3Abin15]|nr:methionine--tRNA ligase [bacterium BMS3Abin15]HDZ85220.1 methionine--tRNA ligase [Candidatus Moranbacteria bacterium]